MDFYKTLELNKNATKEEIKEAYKKLAFKYHPDKHSQSSKAVKENATLRFKELSEAYQVLSDDRKRAEYNIRSSAYKSNRSGYGNGYGYSNYNNAGHSYGYGSNSSYRQGRGYGGGGGLDAVLRFMTTRAFLLNFAFAGSLVGAAYVIDMSGEAIWKINNSGKSFEETMVSVEKAKAGRHEV